MSDEYDDLKDLLNSMLETIKKYKAENYIYYKEQAEKLLEILGEVI